MDPDLALDPVLDPALDPVLDPALDSDIFVIDLKAAKKTISIFVLHFEGIHLHHF